MIPSFTDDRTPPGERDVFNVLAHGPVDWVAFHSLDLAPWNRYLRTEIDFVVIIPDSGILCIEVKSQKNISFDGQRWLPTEIRRSPFKQAADGRFAFYRRMCEFAPRFSEVPVAHCCIFTQAEFELMPNMSVLPWELMDGRLFRKMMDPSKFCADLRKRLNLGIEADPCMHRLSTTISPIEISQIIDICIPVQRYRPDAHEEIRRREEEIGGILREQQKPVLKLVEFNPRLIVSGGAGTGKTLIAMEVARRLAEKGHTVALLCYNRLVGDWMQRQVASVNPVLPNLVVGRAIKIMADMTDVSIPDSPSPDFWENDLPRQIEERLADTDLKAVAAFDYLVIDEAQDLLARPRLWHCLAQFLINGIYDGMFALFGDFDNQVLADSKTMQRELNAIQAKSRPTRWPLSENCRNYRIVGETALLLAGVNSCVYTDYLRRGGGMVNYDIYFFENGERQLYQLRKWLEEFGALGYKTSEITLLSFRDYEHSAAACLKISEYRLRPAWQYGEEISFASIQAFKGMENKVIIMTDVMLASREFHRDLFYTGMTRATECIRVLCDKRSEAVLGDWLSGRM